MDSVIIAHPIQDMDFAGTEWSLIINTIIAASAIAAFFVAIYQSILSRKSLAAAILVFEEQRVENRKRDMHEQFLMFSSQLSLIADTYKEMTYHGVYKDFISVSGTAGIRAFRQDVEDTDDAKWHQALMIRDDMIRRIEALLMAIKDFSISIRGSELRSEQKENLLSRTRLFYLALVFEECRELNTALRRKRVTTSIQTLLESIRDNENWGSLPRLASRISTIDPEEDDDETYA